MKLQTITRFLAHVVLFSFLASSTVWWVAWSFSPDTAKEFFQVTETSSPRGINFLKTDMAGGLATAGMFLILYAIQGREWLKPSIVVVSVFLVTRVISVLIDGGSSFLWFAVGYEAVYLISCIHLLRTSRPQEQAA